MESKIKLTDKQIEKWLYDEEPEFNIKDFRQKHNIDSESSTLNVVFLRLMQENRLKRIGRGVYKKIHPIKAITSLKVSDPRPFDLRFPMGADDCSVFGWDDKIRIDKGDLILIAGSGNSCKTSWVLNMIAENMDYHPCLLMGNEYAKDDNELSAKFADRMVRMLPWANWYKEGTETLKFEILPVDEDYEMWVQHDKINFIDWINMTGEAGKEFYLTAKMLKDIKFKLGRGVGIVVLQKPEGRDWGVGGERTKDLADLYLSIDNVPNSFERKVTIVKCKAATENMDRRMWAFSVVDGGTCFHGIREIIMCPRCRGKSATIGGKCDECNQKGFVNKEN